MKTTIDLPEGILRRAKIIAVQRRTTLKDLVIKGLEFATRQPAQDADGERKARAQKLLAALRKIKITEPIGKFNRDEVYDRDKGKWENSEDLNHGQDYGGVRVINPFAGKGLGKAE